MDLKEIKIFDYFKGLKAKRKVLVTQWCPTLCDPMDCSLPGSSVRGTLQARVLEWVAVSPGDLPNPGIEPGSPALQADALPSEPPGKTGIRQCIMGEILRYG